MSATNYRVKIENPPEDRIEIHLHGPQFRDVNHDLLQDCIHALVGCAHENGCFERGLNVACLGTLAEHHARTRCCETAFGLVGAR